MKVNAPALGAGFRRTDGQGDNAVKDVYVASIGVLKQLYDFAGVVCSHVGHGDKDARNIQFGIDFSLHIS